MKPVVRFVVMKAAWGCRTPRPRGKSGMQSLAPASWSAAASCRFFVPVKIAKLRLRHMIEDEFSHLKHADAVFTVENFA
jgi:hypothetical protein